MPTALSYIHALAAETGEFDSGTTTSAGTTTTLVCSRFVATSLVATEFAGMHFLLESGPLAGQVGHVQGGGLDRSTGTITFANTLTSLVESGVSWSSYRLLSPTKHDATPALLDIVSQALRRLRDERTISFSAVSGQVYYPIDTDAYPWFTDPDRIMWVEAPTTQAQDVPRRLPTTSWDWDANGETKRLYFPGGGFSTGETFKVRVYAPGNSRLVKNATLRAVLTSTAVSSVAVDAGGYYTALPTIAPASGAATFTAVMAVTPGPITSVTVGAGGTYTAGQPPALVVTRHASDAGWADQTDQTAGLLTMTDEALADVADVATMGKARMYDALSVLAAPSPVVVEWLTKARPNIAAARQLQQRGVGEDRTTGVVSLRPTRAYQGRGR
jgi:hypothetical protein